jgi:outer membrane protein TolC
LAIASAAVAEPAGTMTLGEAYRLALRQSEQVMVAIANRDFADTMHTGALTIMGPSATVRSSAIYQNEAEVLVTPGQSPVLQQPQYSWATSAALTQPIFRRQIFDARHAGELGIESSEAALVRARQQLMFDVTQAFIDVLRKRQQLVVAQEAIKRAEAAVESAEKRIKAGGELPTAKLLAQLDLERAQTSANTALGALAASDSKFERLMSTRPPENLVLPATPAIPADPRMVETSQMHRPDVLALHYATEQARATVSQLQGKIFWPTLDLTLQAAYYLTPTAAYPSYGLQGTLTLPLFQTGDEWIQVKLQRQRVRLAAANESLLKRQVGDDVRAAFARLRTAEKALAIANEQIKTANDNYKTVSNQFKFGVAKALDLVTAQAAVIEAETNKLLATYDREEASYQVLLAEGKLSL